jgi:biopolymer transport protein ExbD
MSRYALLRLQASQEKAEPVTEVNVIPVIDISLVLLVILFVTAPLMSYPNLPIDLPKTLTEPDQDQSLSVTLARDERLAVRSVETSWDKLEASLRGELERTSDAAVVLRVDKRVPYRTVQKLMAAAKAAGAKQISLATEPMK